MDNIILSNKNCWIHIKLNKAESVFAKWASPTKINEDPKNKATNKLRSKENINLVIRVKKTIDIKELTICHTIKNLE